MKISRRKIFARGPGRCWRQSQSTRSARLKRRNEPKQIFAKRSVRRKNAPEYARDLPKVLHSSGHFGCLSERRFYQLVETRDGPNIWRQYDRFSSRRKSLAGISPGSFGEKGGLTISLGRSGSCPGLGAFADGDCSFSRRRRGFRIFFCRWEN